MPALPLPHATSVEADAGGALLVREIAYRDPAAAFLPFAQDPVAAFLDSASPGDARGRYSYLAVEPFGTLEARAGRVLFNGQPQPGDPFTVLADILGRHRVRPGSAPVPFATGAVGCLAYELGGVLERLPQRHGNPFDLPDLAFGLYDVVVAFDHQERRGWLLSSGLPETRPGLRRRRAARRADAVLARLAAAPEEVPEEVPETADRPPVPAAAWLAELSEAEYRERVARVLDYIRAGDIFQANFTGRFLAQRPDGLDAYAAHRRLRRMSPAPFAAFLATGRHHLVSASPERFLSLDAAGRIEARPIKGTRPRGADPASDAALAAALAASVKDRAENLMIVDLLRNDLGRVATLGSVRVPVLHQVESFASVHHLVSVIEARLKPGADAVDLLRASFPGGSVTGAPKIRAMEIIDELEAGRRGAYCGAIAWLGLDGAMDSSIVIRTLTLTPDVVIAQAGGGIVADSDPAEEYREMRVKIAPLLACLGGE